MAPTLHLTGDADADALLSLDPLALLIGMLLDQQIRMETAFAGPAKLKSRLGGEFSARAIADTDPAALEALFRQTPSVHRFPGSMAQRTQTLARALLADWDGDAAALWTRGEPDGPEVLRRLTSLPGFGAQKAKIFLALLGKRYEVEPPGWREACAPYGEEGSHRSVADIVDGESLGKVREFKRAAKASAQAGSAAG
ncbi:MAG: Fe-S cluster assembly protein HesB [Micrococcales bacterium]|nr:Fe-S cluster assembly protein HesB [Micrococcales bacterium]